MISLWGRIPWGLQMVLNQGSFTRLDQKTCKLMTLSGRIPWGLQMVLNQGSFTRLDQKTCKLITLWETYSLGSTDGTKPGVVYQMRPEDL